jgi:hypothetical protein
VSVNEDGVFASCGDDGSLHFSDYKTGYNFQKIKSVAQPGSPLTAPFFSLLSVLIDNYIAFHLFYYEHYSDDCFVLSPVSISRPFIRLYRESFGSS